MLRMPRSLSALLLLFFVCNLFGLVIGEGEGGTEDKGKGGTENSNQTAKTEEKDSWLTAVWKKSRRNFEKELARTFGGGFPEPELMTTYSDYICTTATKMIWFGGQNIYTGDLKGHPFYTKLGKLFGYRPKFSSDYREVLDRAQCKAREDLCDGLKALCLWELETRHNSDNYDTLDDILWDNLQAELLEDILVDPSDWTSASLCRQPKQVQVGVHIPEPDKVKIDVNSTWTDHLRKAEEERLKAEKIKYDAANVRWDKHVEATKEAEYKPDSERKYMNLYDRVRMLELMVNENSVGFPFMMGNGSYRPCTWLDKAPKYVSYELHHPSASVAAGIAKLVGFNTELQWEFHLIPFGMPGCNEKFKFTWDDLKSEEDLRKYFSQYFADIEVHLPNYPASATYDPQTGLRGMKEKKYTAAMYSKDEEIMGICGYFRCRGHVGGIYDGICNVQIAQWKVAYINAVLQEPHTLVLSLTTLDIVIWLVFVLDLLLCLMSCWCFCGYCVMLMCKPQAFAARAARRGRGAMASEEPFSRPNRRLTNFRPLARKPGAGSLYGNY